MAEFPALPIFTDALIADTGHLSDEEFGAYMRLLMLVWRSPGCRIPNDDDWIKRRLCRDEVEYRRVSRPILHEFFESSGNWWTQKRLKKEFEYLREQSQKQSARAKSRWNKDSDSCRGNAASGNAPTPTPTPTKNITHNTTQAARGASVDNSVCVLKNEGVKGGIEQLLHDRARETVRKAAPGWDIYNLCREFDAWVVDKPKPDNPVGAFIAFVRKKTGGNPPP